MKKSKYCNALDIDYIGRRSYFKHNTPMAFNFYQEIFLFLLILAVILDIFYHTSIETCFGMLKLSEHENHDCIQIMDPPIVL